VGVREAGWGYMDWINPAQDKILWWAFVNTILSVGFYKMLGNG
jgi:hypothetical protein